MRTGAILVLLFFNLKCISQDTIFVNSFPQPKEVREIYQRSDLELGTLVAFHTNPDIIIYKDNHLVPYVAVGKEYDFEIGSGSKDFF